MTAPYFYVAAASLDWPRAREAMQALESSGMRNSHDWTIHVESAIASGIAESKLDDEIAARIAREDLNGVARSDVLILLAPSSGGKMCFGEMGYALAMGIPVIVASPDPTIARVSIMTRLGTLVTDSEIVETARTIAIERPKWIRHLENLRWLIGEVITHATKRVREPHRYAQLTEEIEGDLHGIGLAYVAAISLSGQSRS